MVAVEVVVQVQPAAFLREEALQRREYHRPFQGKVRLCQGILFPELLPEVAHREAAHPEAVDPEGEVVFWPFVLYLRTRSWQLIQNL